MNSSRLTAVIQKDNAGKQEIAVVPLNQYIDNTHPASINSKNPTEVDIKLNTSFQEIVKDTFDSTESGSNDENNSQIYIVQNYYELLNYLTFILQVEASFDKSLHTTDEIYQYFKENDNGERKFYEKYAGDHSITAQPEQAILGNLKLSGGVG
jgi:hypothetical protein